ncbi:hypothetical protein GCM10023237_05830 [Streptomyces coeruleoprunus]
MTACKSCGREPETGIETHWLGCEVLRQAARGLSFASQCAKDGCQEPRAASKGPRPAKYCDEHKTGSKK